MTHPTLPCHIAYVTIHVIYRMRRITLLHTCKSGRQTLFSLLLCQLDCWCVQLQTLKCVVAAVGFSMLGIAYARETHVRLCFSTFLAIFSESRHFWRYSLKAVEKVQLACISLAQVQCMDWCFSHVRQHLYGLH